VSEPCRSFVRVRGDLACKAGQLMSAMAALGHPLIIVETWRSQERQDLLFAKGRTSPGPIVTWTKASRHTEGCAIDFAFAGSNPYSEMHPWDALAMCAKLLLLEGLGSKDRGHWQV